MSYKKLLLILLVFFVAACDSSRDTPQPETARPAGSADTQNAPTVERRQMTSPQERQALARRYANQVLKVVDVSEIEQEGAKTLSITFNMPLDAEQNVANFVHLSDSESGKVDGAWNMDSTATQLFLRYLEPRRNLTLNIDKGLRSFTGKTLDSEYTTTLQTGDLQASVGFASRGSLLPTRLAEGLPVITLNVDHIDVEFFRIKNNALPQFVSEWENNSRRFATWNADDLLPRTELVYSGRFNLDARRNTRETVLLPIAGLAPLQQPGVYFAVMREAGTHKYYLPATLFTLSDIGLSAHRYHQRLDVYTQALENGDALASVELELLDDKGGRLSTATTGSDGRAELPLTDKAKILLAHQGNDTTLLNLGSAALNLGDFDITGAAANPLSFFVFGPRDLYRPGETVLLNGLLRDTDGRPVPSQPVSVEVVRPDGQTLRGFVWQPGDTGLYQHQLKLSDNAPTGRWRLLFNLGDKDRKTAYEFLVEDFLPERLALEIKGSDKPIAPDAQLQFHVNGRYLYGAPAAGNRLTGRLYIRPLRDAVPNLQGYQFGSVTEDLLRADIDLDDTMLDDNGDATISPKNQWSSVRSPIRLIYQASLQESGGRPITRRIVQPVWPAERMPGIRAQFDGERVGNDSSAEFEIIVADAAGQKFAAQNVKVSLIRERRDYYWSYSDDSGWSSRYSEKVFTVSEDTLDIAGDGSTRVSYPVESGPYRIEVEDPQTGLVSSVRFWAGYSWQDNADGGAVRPDQVKLALDKPAYAAGDVAAVTVTPPAAGNGYLMVESSEGPLWWQAIDVPAEGKQFDIPVPKEWARHDLYISALIVRPGERKTYRTPKRAVGVLHLPLDRGNRKLAVTLEAPEKMRPNQPLKVRVQARTADGKIPTSARVLVSAVDVGILNITDYTTPDPFISFFERRRYEVDQLDIYGQVIEAGQNRLATLAFGGDAALAAGGKRPDTSVLIVALQGEPVTLNDNGEAEISLDIPDFNGSLRLMAQVWADDSFGSAESGTIVAAPLVAELSIPRFLAGGDETRLALDLTNLSGREQRLDVAWHSEGLLTLDDSAARHTITLAEGKRLTLPLDVRATGAYGTGRINVQVSGLDLPGETLPPLQRNWQIGVRPAYPSQITHYRDVLAQNQSWSLPENALHGYDPQGLEMLLSLSSRPPLNLAEQIRELKAYPYGCLEQTVSGLYPALYADKSALDALGLKGDSDEQRWDKIDTGIARIIGMQRGNGSFGAWNRDGDEVPWLTPYAADFLLRASEQGFPVPDTVLKNVSERMLRYLQNAQNIEPDYTDDRNHLRFSVQAYAAYLLARNQQAPLGALRSLYERREAARTALPLVQLAVALKLMGDSPKAEQALREGLNFVPKTTQANGNSNDDYATYYWYGDYGSTLRDAALIYALLEEYNLASPQQRADRLFKLSEMLAAKRWLSTQERNAVFMAGRLLLPRPEQDWQGEITMPTRNLTLDQAHPAVTLDGPDIALPLRIANRSGETLYPQVTLSGYPAKAPAPFNDKMSISRQYLSLDGKTLDLNDLRSGDLILVHLEVAADQRVADALVVDLLPAGLELENQNLGDRAASLQENVASGDVRGWQQAMQGAAIKHQEYRGDRYVAAIDVDKYNSVHLLYLARAVTPGRYIVPPPTVHSMYRPEWQSLGKTPTTLVVKPH